MRIITLLAMAVLVYGTSALVVGAGLIGAILVALITAAPPASRAARLQVVDALAGR